MNGQLLQTCRQLIAYPAILHDLLEDTGTRDDQKDHRDIFHGLPIDCHNRLDTTSLPDAQRICSEQQGDQHYNGRSTNKRDYPARHLAHILKAIRNNRHDNQ